MEFCNMIRLILTGGISQMTSGSKQQTDPRHTLSYIERAPVTVPFFDSTYRIPLSPLLTVRSVFQRTVTQFYFRENGIFRRACEVRMRHLDVIPFISYFIGLRLRVAFGMHYTADPLSVIWRWHHWRAIREHQRYRNRSLSRI